MNKLYQEGFSLIELAVVLVIIGLLVGGGVVALEATQTQTLRSDQERQFKQVRQALYGFVMSEGRLPCPDGPDDDESEDFDGDKCDIDIVSANPARGRLPSADLGVGRRDAWGNPLFYVVTEAYADTPDASPSDESTDTSSFDFDLDGNLVIHDDYDELNATTLADNVPAVVVSFGPQGGQVWISGGFTCPGDGSPADGFSQNETENCGDDPNQFVDAGFSRAEAGERFDDMLLWLPHPVIKARMVQAGKLQ